MDRRNYNRDDVSQGGRPHTYTIRSHEDLIKSHLNLDGARQAKLQNDLGRLAAENDRLRMDLANTQRDLRNKDNEIKSLNDELADRSRRPSTPAARRGSPVYEVDGKQLNTDDVIDHFNVIIQRHHDLINHKNQQIQELQDALDNQPILRKPLTSDAYAQSSKENDLHRQMMDDFSKDMEQLRAEYKKAETSLTDKNKKLERLIEDLQGKLEGYQNEINLLRNELSQREPVKPSESTERLLQEKEKENARLQNLIEELKNQNDGSDDDLKNLVENKKGTVKTVNKMIHDVSSAKDPDTTNLAEVEKDCKTMLSDLNNMNDKLNNILNKLKESPAPAGDGEPLDKRDLIDNLENIKNQCQDEIDLLENKIHPGIQNSVPDIVDRNDDHIRTMSWPTPQSEVTPSVKTMSDRQPYLEEPYRSKKYPIMPCEACSTPYLPQDQDTWITPSQRKEISPPSQRKLIGKPSKHPRPSSQSPEKPKKSKGGCCKKGSDSSNVPYTKKEPEKNKKVRNYNKNMDEIKSKGGGCCRRNNSEEREMKVHEPPREVREKSPAYKIGLGSRMGNDYYYNR